MRRPHRPVENCGTVGWGGILAFVLAFDTWAVVRQRQTLSSGLWKMQTHPLARAGLTASWLILTSHLFLEPEWAKRVERVGANLRVHLPVTGFFPSFPTRETR